MPLIQTDSQHYSDIADAIRDMSGNEETFYPSEMAAGVRSIPQTIAIQPIIYSLEEREVGVWTDGKPLYEKTYSIAMTDVPSNIWTTTGISRGNISAILNSSFSNVNGNYYPFCVGKLNDEIVIRNLANQSITYNGYLTIQYTKTTDTPGSGTWTPSGVPAHHYSTEEQVIGTWFDETLYEKSWDLGENKIIPNNSWYEVTSISANNIQNIVAIPSAMSNTGQNFGNSLIATKLDGSNYVNVQTTRNFGSGGSNTVAIRYLTLQYTKTTD